MTLISSLSLEGIGASLILEGGVDALAFETYAEQIVAPSLQRGQIIVMDNLSVHKVARVQQLIEERGCHLLFLPAYSSEEAFSKIKAFLRRTGARTREALQEAITQALLTVTQEDAHGWCASLRVSTSRKAALTGSLVVHTRSSLTHRS